LYEIVRAMGFHFICVDKVEADDVIATLATYVDKQNIKTHQKLQLFLLLDIDFVGVLWHLSPQTLPQLESLHRCLNSVQVWKNTLGIKT
jgi:hypothetical protein